MIADADLSLIYATDSVDEAIAHVRNQNDSNHSVSNPAGAGCDVISPGSVSAGFRSIPLASPPSILTPAVQLITFAT
jgi:hypothetical protein